MAVHLHRAERSDVLVAGLADLLSQPPPDPFARELVVVPAKGVERWLSQRLAHVLGAGPDGDGVCAAVDFRSPASLVAELTDTVDDDPWSPERLAWPVLQAVDAALDQPWCRPLAVHLGRHHEGEEADLRQGRRYAVARRVAGLLASYAAQRPGVLVDWQADRPLDGWGRPLAPDLRWQPPLWRAVVERVGAPPPHERHAATLARLAAGGADLPGRLSLFGHTRLSVTDLELLGALGRHHDLHLWLPHPSDVLWRALDADADGTGPVPRAADTSHRWVGHPLLVTLSRDVRELQRGLSALTAAAGSPVRDRHHPAPGRPATLLGWLQDDLAADRPRPGGRVLAPDDRSVSVHSCHGPTRQVEVLREVLLGLLEDDPGLEPRDVLVMCPDIETFAPLVNAAFGLGDVLTGGHPAHRLRVRLADRALVQTNPLLGVAAAVLDLAGGRVTASQVLDLTQLAPVRRRFDLSDDDLDTVVAWVDEAGVRWGFDQEHRRPFGLDDFLQNTWAFGLDRVLAGVALSDDSRAWLGPTLPLDDVGSGRVDLAGRLAELVARLREATDALAGARPLAEWVTALGTVIDGLTRVDRDDAWQPAQAKRELARVLAVAGDRDDVELRLADVRALVEERLGGRPTRANFRTGTLTVCTMVPMRSVPHRVVCLLGLDDGVFPRQVSVDGDDVLARDPVTGERDVRSEDRQLLLDAVASATERLVVLYTGADEHSGQDRPAAVPVGELLEALDLTTGAPVRDRILVRHPLQSFDVRNVEPGALGRPQPFSFDPVALGSARAALGTRPVEPDPLGGPLPAPDEDDLTLEQLLGFFRDPVRGFFRALDLSLPWDVDPVRDAMPVEIDQLEAWGVGDRMLHDMVSGVHPDDALQAEWRRGRLPPGRLGWRRAGEIRQQAMALAMAALTHRQVRPRSLDVDVVLGGGRRLTGTVSPVYGDRLVAVGYSRLDGKQLLASWVRLVALSAAHPDQHWTALTVGRAPRGTTPAQRLLGPVDQAPDDLLRSLVALYDAGRRAPLPLPMKTSYAWAQAQLQGGDPREAAERRWSPPQFDGEQTDPAHERVWGRRPPLSVLLGSPRDDEAVAGETTRLGAYAARLWLPLLRSERAL